MGQDANGKIMPQQDIINTNTKPLVAMQGNEHCDTIWWSKSGGYNLIASHMPKHEKLRTSTAGLVMGLSTHHGILQGEITHIYPPHFCHHVSVRSVCDCSQTKEKRSRLRMVTSRTDVLYFAVSLQSEVHLNTLTCTAWYLTSTDQINLPFVCPLYIREENYRKSKLGVLLFHTDKHTFSVYLLFMDSN